MHHLAKLLDLTSKAMGSLIRTLHTLSLTSLLKSLQQLEEQLKILLSVLIEVLTQYLDGLFCDQTIRCLNELKTMILWRQW